MPHVTQLVAALPGLALLSDQPSQTRCLWVSKRECLLSIRLPFLWDRRSHQRRLLPSLARVRVSLPPPSSSPKAARSSYGRLHPWRTRHSGPLLLLVRVGRG